MEKASLVMEHNLNLAKASMLVPSMGRYNCPGCGKQVADVDMTMPITGKKIKIERYGCECWQEAELERILNEAKIKKNKDVYELAGLGERYKRCSFENFRVLPELKTAYETILEYADGFDKYSKEGKGLFIRGGYGVGKSHLCSALVKELIFLNYTCRFILVPELLELLRKSYNTKLSEDESYKLNKITSVELLVLDDLGSERSSPWVQEQLYLILNKRYESMLPTVASSNCSSSEIEEKLGERIASRLLQSSIMIWINAPDFRLRNKGAQMR